MRVFGKFDRVIAGIAIGLMALILYGKILSDFAEFYITGHTTQFLWVVGDLGKSNPLGSYNLVGFIGIAGVGYCNLVIWRVLLSAMGKPVHRFLSKYEIRRKDNILVVRSKKGRVAK